MSTVKVRFKAAALYFLFVAAFLFSPASAFADFRLDSSLQVASLALSPLDALGTAYITRAALGALGVEIAGSLPRLSPDDVAKALWYGGGSTLPPTFTFAEHLVDYFSRETIRIRPNSVTIGGVEYSDVWLPHDCADKFRTNAFDFITRYSISSESNGTFVSGVGFVGDYQVFGVGSSYVTQTVLIPKVAGSYSVPGGTAVVLGRESYYPSLDFTWLDGSVLQDSLGSRFWPYSIRAEVSISSGNITIRGHNSQDSSFSTKASLSSSYFDRQPFDFSWAATTIPADPLPDSYGIRLRVPASIVSSLPQILDPDSASYDSDIESLISGLETSASEGTLTDPAFEEWDTPVPPASGTIADEPYSSLSGALSGISSFLNTISTSLSGIAESIISGDAGFFGNVVSALAAPFEPVFAIFRSGVGIWHYVVSWVGTISAPFTWSLSALGSAGSYFLSPIYAVAAAAVVLAVYKKFGR